MVIYRCVVILIVQYEMKLSSYLRFSRPEKEPIEISQKSQSWSEVEKTPRLFPKKERKSHWSILDIIQIHTEIINNGAQEISVESKSQSSSVTK